LHALGADLEGFGFGLPIGAPGELLEGSVSPLQIELVHDRGGMPMRKVVLVSQPPDAFVETQEPGPGIETPQPLLKGSSGRLGNSGDQHLMSFFGVV
jgi:hypothetical protein